MQLEHKAAHITVFGTKVTIVWSFTLTLLFEEISDSISVLAKLPTILTDVCCDFLQFLKANSGVVT
jgi:hypothetical protein